jgi:hypothetical protein
VPSPNQLASLDQVKEEEEANELKPAIVEPQNLFIVTLGSQEGAFENVRMTYAGDHGPQIKQLF